LKLSLNAKTILEKRYLKKENGKVIESPEDMFSRVAHAVANAEIIFNPQITELDLSSIYQKFYSIMVDWDFLPNSPTLMNAGRELGQLSACFVLPVNDSMEEIFNAVKDAALIHKSGGGTGFSFSRIRPKNSPVKSTGGVASGPVSFMRVFNAATEAIKQGGTRRGANMGILRVDHPDILEFISCKADNSDITNFNISVGITNEFISALENDEYYELKFDGNTYSKLKAKEVFSLIVERAWANGEPGIIFLDRLNENNPTPSLGEIEATNPCGEQPLLGYEACNLGSINLANVVDENKTIKWDKLSELVKWSVRFLDNVIEINVFPIERINEMVLGNRKIGLGVMGWADALFKLGIPYDSEEAIGLARKIMHHIQQTAHTASSELASERGSFPNIGLSIYNGTLMRNATCTTIAPTGTISMIAGASSGIEPVFSLAYTKNVLDGAALVDVNPVFEKFICDSLPLEAAKMLFSQVAEKGSVQGVGDLSEEVQRRFVSALEIAPEWHIKMQAAFQEYCDNAVSKTVNFPYHATLEDVEKVYRMAYSLGCKGITVYRSGSRESEVLVAGIAKASKKAGSEPDAKRVKIFPRPRPKRTLGVTEQVKTGCGKMYITVNADQEGLIETFITTCSSGGCSGFTEGVSRLISLALRANIAPEAIIDQLTSVSCPNFLRRKVTDKNIVGKSCPDIIGIILTEDMKLLVDKERRLAYESLVATCNELTAAAEPLHGHEPITEEQLLRRGLCPECRLNLRFMEGCLTCTCGFSKCG